MKIRPARLADRDRILQILIATERFTADEVRGAIELVDQALGSPPRPDYLVHVAEDREGVLGYVLYGPTPKTEGVYDLYWIAVVPAHQRHGVGDHLLRFAEDQVKAKRGRMLLIETSSKRGYEPAREFYERHGYQEMSRIKDFYRIEDDKIIYGKTV